MVFFAMLMMLLGAGGQDINYEKVRQQRRLKAVRIDSEIIVDGQLDEDAWSQAPVATGFIQNEPQPGQPASEQTEVRVL
jgi:hypothetical protein